MPATFEEAPSGRAKCRGCGKSIPKGNLRLGERLPNLFTDKGEMTLWFHLPCGAYRRPEAFLEALAEAALEVPDADRLRATAELGVAHPRLARIDGRQPAPTGRARCRQCREPIDKGSLRIALQFFEDARFVPAGFLHPGCASEYFGTDQYADRVAHFTDDPG